MLSCCLSNEANADVAVETYGQPERGGLNRRVISGVLFSKSELIWRVILIQIR